jgi:hypothetical protein
MLFRFDCEPAELLSCNTQSLEIAISELLAAHRCGYHLVVMNIRVSEWFKKNVVLNSSDAALVHQIGKQYAQFGEIHHIASAFVSIVAKGALMREGRKIVVPIEKISQTNLTERSVLLAENSKRDGELYRFISRAVARDCRVPNIDMELQHGGGADLPNVFVERMNDSRIVLAVVDSDKDSPFCNKKGMLAKLETAWRNNGFWVGGFFVMTPCRELENVIPMNVILLEGSICDNGFKKILFDIEEAERAKLDFKYATRLWLFVDLKNGLTSPSEMRFSNEHSKSWYVAKLRRFCEVIPVSGFGDHLIDVVLAKKTVEMREELKRRDWKDHFLPFFKEMCWVFCSAKKQIT